MNQQMQGVIVMIGALCIGLGADMVFTQGLTASISLTGPTTVQKNPNDLREDFGIVGDTVFNKKRKIAYNHVEDFWRDSGKSSWEGLILDRMDRLPEGMHFANGLPLTPDDYCRTNFGHACRPGEK